MPELSIRGVLAGVGVVVVAAVCIRLGFWQLDRLDQRRALNAMAATAMELPPLDLNLGGRDSLATDPANRVYRRAVARGLYDASGEVLLRGRSNAGRPGVHVVTPMHLPDEGMTILVNRGWLPSPDAATIDPRPYRLPGPIVVEGLLFVMPDAPTEAAPLRITMDGYEVTSYRRLDRTTLSDSLGMPLPQLYLQELPQSRPAGNLPFPVAPPEFDEGPHLGYAIQWFSFAAIALGGFGFFVFFGEQVRRKG